MNNDEAKFILAAYRPNGQDATDPLFAEPLAQARRDPELQAWLDTQLAFDAAVAAKLHDLQPPLGLRDTLLAGAGKSRREPWWRSRGRRSTRMVNLPVVDRDLPDSGENVAACLDAVLVMVALHAVDLVFREALTLFYLQEISYHEIAKILSVRKGVVNSRIYCGKQLLRALIERRETDQGVIGFALVVSAYE